MSKFLFFIVVFFFFGGEKKEEGEEKKKIDSKGLPAGKNYGCECLIKKVVLSHVILTLQSFWLGFSKMAKKSLQNEEKRKEKKFFFLDDLRAKFTSGTKWKKKKTTVGFGLKRAVAFLFLSCSLFSLVHQSSRGPERGWSKLIKNIRAALWWSKK